MPIERRINLLTTFERGDVETGEAKNGAGLGGKERHQKKAFKSSAKNAGYEFVTMVWLAHGVA